MSAAFKGRSVSECWPKLLKRSGWKIGGPPLPSFWDVTHRYPPNPQTPPPPPPLHTPNTPNPKKGCIGDFVEIKLRGLRSGQDSISETRFDFATGLTNWIRSITSGKKQIVERVLFHRVCF